MYRCYIFAVKLANLQDCLFAHVPDSHCQGQERNRCRHCSSRSFRSEQCSPEAGRSEVAHFLFCRANNSIIFFIRYITCSWNATLLSIGVGRGGHEGAVAPPGLRHFLVLTIKTRKIASKSEFFPLVESGDVVLTCLPPLGKFSADAHARSVCCLPLSAVPTLCLPLLPGAYSRLYIHMRWYASPY